MRKRIIIVEDDPGIQDALKLIFASTDYDVTIYKNGSFLLENSFQIPDLFILDKQLSGVDGLDLCRFLKQLKGTQNIPVIIISASPGIERLAEEAGAETVIHKPFKIHTIRDVTATFLPAS
jgi:CheY-like chemotaxis protein